MDDDEEFSDDVNQFKFALVLIAFTIPVIVYESARWVYHTIKGRPRNFDEMK